MRLPPLIRPHVQAYPTLDTALWFLHLRWLAVVGQLLTLTVVSVGLKVSLPLVQIVTLITLTAATNIAYWFWLARLHRSGLQLPDRLPTGQPIRVLMFVDLLDLTGLLYLSAGTANPFWLFYFVNVAIAAAIVAPRWAWALWGCTVACIVLLLTVDPQPVELLNSLPNQAAGSARWTMFKLGYFVSFVACSGIITYFITILTGELRLRERAIKDAEVAKSRNRQLESMATLAGGAAHELASPLSTIAVVAKELSRALVKHSAPASVVNDALLIRSELDRCRQILDRMTAAAGEAAGEQLKSVLIDEIFRETLLGIREVDRIQVSYDLAASRLASLLPVQAAAQSLRNLIQNALDATPSGLPVCVSASVSEDNWLIEVSDQGDGMPQEILQRLGEPFFTTKEPGKGMGLGVYLAMNVVRRLGGDIQYSSQPGQGTKALVRLPVAR